VRNLEKCDPVVQSRLNQEGGEQQARPVRYLEAKRCRILLAEGFAE
jgi:hypothetical protein